MPISLIHYDDRPPSKLLPGKIISPAVRNIFFLQATPQARGTLSASRSEALAAHCFRWVLANLLLFLLPSFAEITVILLWGSQLGIYGHGAPETLAYSLEYFSVWSGSALIFIGQHNSVFPATFTHKFHKPHSCFHDLFATTLLFR
jgi:hypothetical protein